MIKRNRKREKFINIIEANKMMDEFVHNDIRVQKDYVIDKIKKAAKKGEDRICLNKLILYKYKLHESIERELIENGFKIKQDNDTIYISW